MGVDACDSRTTTVVYHPQQSVLKPQAGQRQTACMRYISAPQRSQSIFVAGCPSTALSGDWRMTVERPTVEPPDIGWFRAREIRRSHLTEHG